MTLNLEINKILWINIIENTVVVNYSYAFWKPGVVLKTKRTL